MKPVLIGKNEQRYNETVDRLQRQLPEYNKVLQAFKALNAGDLSIHDLDNMRNPEKFLKDRVIGQLDEGKKLGGIPIKREKLLDMVELPEGAEGFTQAVEELARKHGKTGSHAPGDLAFRLTEAMYFKIKNGEVIIDPEALAELEERCCYYAETEEQLAYFQGLKKLADQLNAVMPTARKFQHLPNGWPNLDGITIYKDRFVVNPEHIVSAKPRL